MAGTSTDIQPVNVNHFIKCPRFGGSRPATACVHYDRFKHCRRWCQNLKAHIGQHPDFVEETKKYFAEKAATPRLVQLDLLPSKHSGKQIPDPKLACRFCRFVGKSERGLKSHMTRSHGNRG